MTNDKCKMSKIRRLCGGINVEDTPSLWRNKCPGFSLIEVLVVLALMAFFASAMLVAANNIDDRGKYEKTQKMLSEIRDAIVGKPGIYCNGWRQFTGYVSDMGVLPGLVDDHGNEVDKGGQPRALWTRDLNSDGDTEDEGIDIGHDFLWRYYENFKIWAGWRGPYLKAPLGGILRDAWGNPFMFVTGELVTVKGVWAGDWIWEEETYRWLKDFHYASGGWQWKLPGFFSCWDTDWWNECWQAFPDGPILDPPERALNVREDKYEVFIHNIYYGKDNALTIYSLGADGKPGGKLHNRDIALTIYRTDWTGEVAGHAGYSGNRYVDEVVINYPRFKQGEDPIIKRSEPIQITDNDSGYGINFRFGTAFEVGDLCKGPDCGYENYENFKKISIPMGMRSVKTTKDGIEKTYVFNVEPTGNWVGTIH